MYISHYTQEEQFVAVLTELGVSYRRPAGRLDFYLPDFNLYVELKTYPCERLEGQLESVMPSPVMVLCGPDSVAAFREFLKACGGA